MWLSVCRRHGRGRINATFNLFEAAFDALKACSYDSQGNPTGITNAAGHVTIFNQYDQAGRVRKMTDPKGVLTDSTYTPRGWIASTTVTPQGGVARTTPTPTTTQAS